MEYRAQLEEFINSFAIHVNVFLEKEKEITFESDARGDRCRIVGHEDNIHSGIGQVIDGIVSTTESHVETVVEYN